MRVTLFVKFIWIGFNINFAGYNFFYQLLMWFSTPQEKLLNKKYLKQSVVIAWFS